MNDINTMEELRKFLRTYPPLSDNKINVDFLPDNARSYAVEAVPAQSVIRTYVNGDRIEQTLFVLASREYYGAEIRQQLDNLGFYEDFSRWLDAQTRGKNLPYLGKNRRAIKLEATTCGYAFAAEEDKARYQIQCRMEYFVKR